MWPAAGRRLPGGGGISAGGSPRKIDMWAYAWRTSHPHGDKDHHKTSQRSGGAGGFGVEGRDMENVSKTLLSISE